MEIELGFVHICLPQKTKATVAPCPPRPRPRPHLRTYTPVKQTGLSARTVPPQHPRPVEEGHPPSSSSSSLCGRQRWEFGLQGGTSLLERLLAAEFPSRAIPVTWAGGDIPAPRGPRPPHDRPRKHGSCRGLGEEGKGRVRAQGVYTFPRTPLKRNPSSAGKKM